MFAHASRNSSTQVRERFANFVAPRSKGSVAVARARSSEPSERKAIPYENRVRGGLRWGGGVAGRGPRGCVRSLAEFRAVHSNEA